MSTISHKIATELQINTRQVDATVQLLKNGCTVPFIARYRKEATGSLNDHQLRILEERLFYLNELEERRIAILKIIREKGKLTPELEKEIHQAETKVVLEDLYLPYKEKRITKGQLAIEAGLQSLADSLWKETTIVPEEEAKKYINAEKKIHNVKEALEGARFILMETFSESAQLLQELREYMWKNSFLNSQVVEDKKGSAEKFSDYFSYTEKIRKIPSHRALALLRGKKQNFLRLSCVLSKEEVTVLSDHPCVRKITEFWQISEKTEKSANQWISETIQWAWKLKILPKIETDLVRDLREQSEKEAITVFSKNLKDLLLTPPAYKCVTMGLDPALRTGVKVAIIDDCGDLLDHATIYPHPPQNKGAEAKSTLIKLILKHQVKLIAIGNGTASRETDRFVLSIIHEYAHLDLKKVMVNEAGASVYSASKIAAEEFPDLDVVFRGAVSIARRLQDPLAELVKIDPKSIGVGQYQHDVNQKNLKRSLEAIVEDCVNYVGVDINTASSTLLCHIAGLNPTLADNIVKWRHENGPFKNREQILSVDRLGDKCYQQAAGFLRIIGGDNLLDMSSVHPESYDFVEKIAQKYNKSVTELIGATDILSNIVVEDFVSASIGLPTILDIINELKKPGRDPRSEFKIAHFKEGVQTIADVKENMILEGVISNVTNFGAFIDLGVHQDGLVHISSLCRKFVKDPRDIVKVGDVVKVKVISVDQERRRISLSMFLDEDSMMKIPNKKKDHRSSTKEPVKKKREGMEQVKKKQIHNSRYIPKQGTFADLFNNAKKLRQ